MLKSNGSEKSCSRQPLHSRRLPPLCADEYVHGYYRSNGTYVQPYFRSDPDGNPTTITAIRAI